MSAGNACSLAAMLDFNCSRVALTGIVKVNSVLELIAEHTAMSFLSTRLNRVKIYTSKFDEDILKSTSPELDFKKSNQLAPVIFIFSHLAAAGSIPTLRERDSIGSPKGGTPVLCAR